MIYILYKIIESINSLWLGEGTPSVLLESPTEAACHEFALKPWHFNFLYLVLPHCLPIRYQITETNDIALNCSLLIDYKDLFLPMYKLEVTEPWTD